MFVNYYVYKFDSGITDGPEHCTGFVEGKRGEYEEVGGKVLYKDERKRGKFCHKFHFNIKISNKISLNVIDV